MGKFRPLCDGTLVDCSAYVECSRTIDLEVNSIVQRLADSRREFVDGVVGSVRPRDLHQGFVAFGLLKRMHVDTLAVLDESKKTLAGRVARLETGMAWAEDPPSRTRHLITNIEVEPEEAGASTLRPPQPRGEASYGALRSPCRPSV